MPSGAHDAGLHAVGQHLDLLAFVMLGILGSAAHCVGMCSPFVLLVSRRYAAPGGRHSPMAAQLWYASGRLVTYAALGAVAGTMGGVVQVTGDLIGLQRAAAMVAGAALVAWALAGLFDRIPSGRAHGTWIARVTRRLYGRVPGHPLTLGLCLGLLPCGLLYAAMAGAVGRGGPVAGAAALVAFGLGTAPALLGVSLADALLVSNRPGANRFSQGFVLVMGVWFLWRGFVPLPIG